MTVVCAAARPYSSSASRASATTATAVATVETNSPVTTVVTPMSRPARISNGRPGKNASTGARQGAK